MSDSTVSAKRDFARPALAAVAEARAAMLAGMTVLGEESVALGDALGRVLAAPVIAARDQPPFAVSEMDGYAFNAAGTPGRLNVIGESAAGHGFTGLCGPGMAVRISTGAALPDGADAVTMQEEVQREGDVIDVPEAKAGQHVRRRAMDFTAGTGLLEKGRRLDGVALALAAAMGMAHLPVARRPRVAILSGGDELAEPGAAPGPFQIFDSGTYGIAGLIAALGWGAASRWDWRKTMPPASRARRSRDWRKATCWW